MLPAADLLVRLDRRRTVHHLSLDRLTVAEVASFLASVYGRSLPSRTADVLHSRTGGNPFFLEEILSAAGDADPDALATQPLPFTLAEIVRRQLDGLTGDERRVIDAAAVLGRGASFDVLATVTHMTEAELIGHLRELVDRGLITEDRPDEFTFRHALVRDAVEDQLLGRERRRLHEAALAALKGSPGADLAGLAKHAQGAGRFDEFLDLAQEGATYYLERGSSYQAFDSRPTRSPRTPTASRCSRPRRVPAWLVGLNDEAFGHARRWRERAEARSDLVARSRGRAHGGARGVGLRSLRRDRRGRRRHRAPLEPAATRAHERAQRLRRGGAGPHAGASQRARRRVVGSRDRRGRRMGREGRACARDGREGIRARRLARPA